MQKDHIWSSVSWIKKGEGEKKVSVLVVLLCMPIR